MSFAQAHLRRSAVQTAIRSAGTSSINAMATSSSITSTSRMATSISIPSYSIATSVPSSFCVPTVASLGTTQQQSPLLDSFLFSASTAQKVSSGISALQSADNFCSVFGNVKVSKTPMFEVSSHATALTKVHRELRFAMQKKHSKLAFSKVLAQLLNKAFQKQRRKDFDIFHANFIPVMHEYAHKQWKKYSMDKTDRAFLHKYCNSKMYRTMNTALRASAVDGTPLAKKNKENMEGILKCMTKRKMQSLQVKGTVYRGVRDLPASIKCQMKPGATFADPAFLSTSISKEDAYEGAFAGGVRFVIKSKTGFSIAKWSSYDEHEVLFPPNTMFMIQSIFPGEGKVEAVITMEEI